jgi:hypothetical protein
MQRPNGRTRLVHPDPGTLLLTDLTHAEDNFPPGACEELQSKPVRTRWLSWRWLGERRMGKAETQAGEDDG